MDRSGVIVIGPSRPPAHTDTTRPPGINLIIDLGIDLVCGTLVTGALRFFLGTDAKAGTTSLKSMRAIRRIGNRAPTHRQRAAPKRPGALKQGRRVCSPRRHRHAPQK
jgi:hypothetical protein